MKKRSNSLRRAKNSTELLKQRAIEEEKSPKYADSSIIQRGRNFTVSNVTTGGLLHLSPSPHQGAFPPVVAAPSPYPWMSATGSSVLPTTAGIEVQPQAVHSRTRSISPKRLLGGESLKKTSTEVKQLHNRSQSFSTIDESRRSVVAALQPKTLKIVIDRPESAHSTEEEEAVPTLSIPIPHYKLGTPRFSAHGTPFLRGSSYNRASGADSTNHSSMIDLSNPPSAGTKPMSKLHYTISSDESAVPMPYPLRLHKTINDQRSISVLSRVAPITAEQYDKLLQVYNDPTVVRYANGDREIAAAVKIRIIAQISSDSFMDYDLVSDFFLTFRSYMTTFEVLDYLLARLKWSIGRLSDDGRIIRIRTFAALRHWILNYFAEDFVVNRHLRVRFCEEVNNLYDSVRQRPRGVGGVSDLKILQDLKRCWNGRCALFWDAEEFNMDTDQEEPLLPGGVLGSRNPAYADISEATAALGLGLHSMSEPLTSPLPRASFQGARKTQHKRLPSSEYAKKPLSIESAQSLQPKSCSLPRRSPNHDGEQHGRGPQPVSVLSRRQNAPSDLKVHVQNYEDGYDKETAITSAEQTPVQALVNSGHYVEPHAGSMIRGFVYGPVEPFIQLPLNPPLSPSVRFSAEQKSSMSARSPSSPHKPTHGAEGPAVKNIFGSIRRAISGKQGTNEVTLITVSSPRPSASQAGLRAPVPMNMARSNDDLRRKAAGVPPKTQLRIDLLCAAAIQSFQTVVPGTHDAQTENGAHQATKHIIQPLPFSPPLSSPNDSTRQDHATRLHSHDTARSGSILIVDDTAVAMPVMSGALPGAYVHHEVTNTPERQSPMPASSTQHASFETQIAFVDKHHRESLSDDDYTHDIGIARSTGLAAPTLGEAYEKSRSTSAVTVRKLEASPVIVEQGQGSTEYEESLRSTSPPSMTEATSTSESPVSKAPAHGLRRRPGGDLRKNQNVQDLETVTHHQSLDSMLDSSSTAGSLLIMGRPPTKGSTPARGKMTQKVSMINTHSSQHLRPSFEAAVAGFSAIPDDNDGGLEATLMKLEGKYSPDPSDPSMSPTTRSFAGSSEQPMSTSTDPTDHDAMLSRTPHRNKEDSLANVSFLHDENVDPKSREAQKPHFVHRSAVFGLPTESEAGSDSEESDISLPILKRNTTIGKAVTSDSPQPDETQLEDEDDVRSSSDILESKHLAPSDIARPSTAHTDGARSFFLDDDENVSDLSSEISVDILNYTDVGDRPVSPMLAAPGTAISGLEIPSHPLTHASLVNLSIQTSPNLATGSSGVLNPILTPQASPLLGQDAQRAKDQPSKDIVASLKLPRTAGPTHVPFVLACESDTLAQQLTIVEQSALTEIEWTDLVEMRWSNDKSTSSLDWAEYMAKHDDARGIDVVTTRFNLVIKWVLSEIVLTEDVEERARVLSKFIHVAAHARRLRNYATMLQITIALMATACTRLKKTWDLVPGPDRSILKHMEKLAQPMRNFHQLRIEMESTDLSNGCIPFLMLYVHDLTYNAQKPAEIHVSETTEPLINFERFRTAAIIIKGLLRLIDASLRYDFEPIHGIVERCLWLSALTDTRIDALSKSLE